MSADSDAFAVIQTLPISPIEGQYSQSVARGEGFYGLGWGNPGARTIAKSEEMGVDPRAGVGSNNWGAEQGSGSAGSFPHIDTRADGTFYVGQYKKHRTPAEGAAAFTRILLKPNLKAALATGFYPGPIMPPRPNGIQKKYFDFKKQFTGQHIGPLKAAVFTQHDNRYYELDPAKYLEAVSRNYDILTANLRWPPLLKQLVVGTIADSPLVGSGSSSESEAFSGTELPEAGFLRGQTFSVPGIQDEPKK